MNTSHRLIKQLERGTGNTSKLKDLRAVIQQMHLMNIKMIAHIILSYKEVYVNLLLGLTNVKPNAAVNRLYKAGVIPNGLVFLPLFCFGNIKEIARIF